MSPEVSTWSCWDLLLLCCVTQFSNSFLCLYKKLLLMMLLYKLFQKMLTLWDKVTLAFKSWLSLFSILSWTKKISIYLLLWTTKLFEISTLERMTKELSQFCPFEKKPAVHKWLWKCLELRHDAGGPISWLYNFQLFVLWANNKSKKPSPASN